MVVGRKSGVKGGKSVCTKGQGVKSRDNIVASWCAGSRAWRKVEDNRVSDKELLVAGSNKRHGKIYREMWHVSKDKEQDGGTSREVKVEWGAGETVNSSNGGLYYKVTSNGWKRCNFSYL